jgi:hypothetical protein
MPHILFILLPLPPKEEIEEKFFSVLYPLGIFPSIFIQSCDGRFQLMMMMMSDEMRTKNANKFCGQIFFFTSKTEKCRNRCW